MVKFTTAHCNTNLIIVQWLFPSLKDQCHPISFNYIENIQKGIIFVQIIDISFLMILLMIVNFIMISEPI